MSRTSHRGRHSFKLLEYQMVWREGQICLADTHTCGIRYGVGGTLYLIVYIMVLCQWRVCCNSGVGAGLCTLQKTIFSILTWCHYQNGTAAPLKWDRIIPAAIINNCRVNDQISFKIHEGKGGRHHRRRPISLVHSLGIDHFYYNVPFFADEHELPRSCFTFRVYASPFSKCMKCASPRKKSL